MPTKVEDISFDMQIKNYNKIRRFLTQISPEQINSNIKVRKQTTSNGGDALQLPLQLACSKYDELGSDFGLVRSLIEKGADVNARTDYSATPLSIVAKTDNIELAKLLLEHGAEVNTANASPLIRACLGGNCIPMVQLLIAKGADVNKANDKTGETALHVAVENGDPELVKLLIENGANVNAVKKNGETVIMAAVEDGNVEIIKLLLKNLAEIGSLEDAVWQKIFKTANNQNKTEGVKYIKEFQNYQGLMPLLYQSKVDKDEKKRWPTDLVRKTHHTLTGNNAPDPKKPHKPQ